MYLEDFVYEFPVTTYISVDIVKLIKYLSDCTEDYLATCYNENIGRDEAIMIFLQAIDYIAENQDELKEFFNEQITLLKKGKKYD